MLMSNHNYHFVTHWRMNATAQEVSDILSKAEDLARWWPSVYLNVTQLEAGDANGIGKRIDLYTKGWLPYTLRWQFVVTEVDSPRRLALRAEGDFVGRGIWIFEQEGDWVNIQYDWEISAEKPLLKSLSFLLKPIFEKNHVWAMRHGEESLRLELERLHATTDEQRAQIPDPPAGPPTNPLRWIVHVLTNRSG